MLDIKQRLTITLAVLTGLVLFPAGFAVEVLAERSISSEGIRLAQESARHAAETVLEQWDEEFLVEFGEGSVFFRDLKVEISDWALFRPNGRVEWAAGVFAAGVLPQAAGGSKVVPWGDARSVRIASVSLLESHSPTLRDLPEAVRAVLMREAPAAIFLRARREMKGHSAIFEVKVLDVGRIHEFRFTSDGKLLSRGAEDAPRDLPKSLVALLTEGTDAYVADPPRWTAFEGQLLAVVKLAGPSGAERRVAVNRLGERFLLNEGGAVVEREEASRLYLSAALDVSSEVQSTGALRGALWVGGGLAWSLLIVASWFVARRAMAPVQGIVEAVKTVEVHKLTGRLPVSKANDELSRIAETINTMLGRIEVGYERERRFTGDVSHELRTPLSKFIAEIDLALGRDRQGEEYRAILERLKGYAASMQGLVDALLLLAKLEDGAALPPPEPFDMGSLAADIVGGVPRETRERVRLRLEKTADPLMASGDRSLIGVLLRNLVDNALRYSPAQKPVFVDVSSGGESVITRVADQGEGIPEGARDRVFDRFFRLDVSRSRETGGAGLGLSIAEAIARVHGTKVDLTGGPEGGTIASFALRKSKD